ncbi:MAG: NHLP leader peptide family RiPP precursor [Bacteroidota bacterium]
MELSRENRLVTTIVNKAWEDEDFKARLIANPIEEIKKLTGEAIDIPHGKRLVIVDQSNPTEMYINIPPQPKMDEDELDDDALDLVAGGGGTTPPKLGDPTSGG